jgi:signal peptide peptidase SppA
MHDAVKELQRSQFWAITPHHLRAIRAGAMMAEPEIWAARGAVKGSGDVSVVPIMGVLTQRGGWFGTSVERCVQSFRQAMADGSKAVVLEFDTPGGEVLGIEEFATEIRQSRGSKPIVASVNSMCASAGYYLGAQADEIIVTPSGLIGSVGVYGTHADWSKALDQAGIVVTLVSAGEGKTDGNMFEPLSDEARADMQTDVDRYYGMFVSAVAKGRDVSVETVRGDWKAKLYGAKDAVTNGMATSVGTFEGAVRRALSLASGKQSAVAALDVDVETRMRLRKRSI